MIKSLSSLPPFITSPQKTTAGAASGAVPSDAVTTGVESHPGPREIVLIRHAEKPGAANVDAPADGTGLSARGVERAQALASALPGRYPHIDYVIATAPSQNSNRPVLTVQPLAARLGLPVDQSFANKQFGQLADALLHDSKYDGKTIVVCWHHGKIPQLARALGVEPPQDPWPDSQFDRIWQIDYNANGAATVTNLPQSLLPGDST